MTAKMKMMIQRTKVRLPRAPIVFPMMEMRRLRVGQDLASLNTLSWNDKYFHLIWKQQSSTTTYQPKRSKDGKTGDIVQAELEE